MKPTTSIFMKPTASIIQRNFALSSRLRGRHRNRALTTAFMTALASAATPLSQAAQLTWSGGGGDGNWSTGANWAGTAPVTGDALIFAGNTTLITNNDIIGLTLNPGTTPTSAIAFTNANATTGGNFTLGGNATTLGGPITTTAMTTGTLVDTISLQLDIAANRTITTATNHGLIISGLVNDTSGTNSGGITKVGVATLLLSNDLNNFTTLAIQQGTVSATSIEPSGTACAIGIGNTITLGGATTSGILNFTGTVAPTGNINRAIALANSTIGGVINNNSTAAVALVFNGSFTAAGSGNRTMSLGGANTGANDFQNILVDPSSPGILSVTKADAGAWRLSGANTYTGQTNINSGTLNVASIADSGSSNLGLGTLIRIGNGGTTSILNYTGAGNSTTARTVSIGNSSPTPVNSDTGGATINSNGSGALVFTAANFNTTSLASSGNFTRTLTLGGANAGANEIRGVIANGNGSTMTTNLAKSGSGTWRLSGNNTYTGTTTINAGTLKLGASNVLPNTAVTIGATGAATTSTLDLNGFSETIGSLSLGRTTTTVAGAIANVANNGGGSPVLTLGGALTYFAGSVGFENGQATIFVNIDTGGAGRNIIVGDGSAAVDLVISGNISGTGSLTKSGAGVFQLSGANTNVGSLIIQDSTVKLGASNVLIDSTAINVGTNLSTAGSTFDLNGFSDSVAGVTLGSAAPTAAGFINSIISTGGTGVLTLGGTLTYNAGGANLNGQATIFADVATNTGTRNFLVGDGSATDDLVITGALQAGGGFNLNGGGTMRLDNAGNSHTTSQVSGGSTLKLGADSVLGTAAVNLAQASAGTATFDLNGKTDAVGGALNLSTATTTSLGAINQIIDSVGGGVLQLNGAVSYNAGAVGFNNGTTTVSASLDLNGALRNFNIDDSDQVAQDVIISGVIQNSTGTSGIGKNNAGTLVLAGVNTYNGNTNVNAGTLELADNASIKFTLGATTGVNNSINGLGTAILNGDFVIDTSAADALSSGSWTLENVTSLTGAYGSTFTVSGFSNIGSEKWEKTIGGGKKYTFDETTGILTLAITSGSPYTAWAASKGLTGLPGSATDPAKDADPDKDGRNNLGEFAFNGDPLSGSDNGKVYMLTEDSDFDGDATKELILTVAVLSPGTPTFTGSPSPTAINTADGITYSIEGSLDLASFPTTVNVVPTAVTTGLPAAGAGYVYRSFSLNGSNGLTGKGFLRAKVTSP
jgi:fibronectin-binding autotransporter adhesin